MNIESINLEILKELIEFLKDHGCIHKSESLY